MQHFSILANILALCTLISAQTNTTTTTRTSSTVTITTTRIPTTVTSSSATSTVTLTPTVTTGTATSSTIEPPLPTVSNPVYTTTVSYDTTYDNRNGSLTSVACSDGKNGLITKGFTTFGSLPKYPLIGGAFAVASWNSTSCGSCWELAYTTTSAGGVANTTKVNVLAIDVAVDSFNIALSGLNQLTGGKGVELGRVKVLATQVNSALCGL
ncbi:Cerato-platanin-domain-containing protein [Coprinellus micaceus]|uniref:Cerato-platanin-domain-containing protein n=1 Tax=Coprinellus micaceus TaxID=71717 RepID=A0A4Y7TAZ6_COPMI|nr:Cerato-platanin-domain-containing protein [Coprinellus micaceus]